MEAAIQIALGSRYYRELELQKPGWMAYKSAYSMLRELAEHRFLLGTCR